MQRNVPAGAGAHHLKEGPQIVLCLASVRRAKVYPSITQSKADVENDGKCHQHVASAMEDALEIGKATTPEEIARAVAMDEALSGPNDRTGYIMSVAKNGGLSVAVLRGEVQGFCLLDHGCFFGKPFISLLIVSPDARRLGLGTGLLSHISSGYPEVWTSTNRSNSAMRRLLDKAGWRYCGVLSGLDAGDPERFYRTA